MSKRIIFCADGTWDTAQNDTNVYKLFKATPFTSDQVASYDDGVGSDGTPIEKLAGGAIAAGLFQKIKDGYTRIAHVYEQGDELFLFGFSRGAFTARSLAGMIAICGLPTGAFDDNLVNTAFQAYRDKLQRAALLASLNKYALFDAKIKMLGVWDTVGSLGIPALLGKVDPVLYGFLDTSLHPDVLNAYQALAIDERRQEFPPTLWTPPSPPVAGQVLEQVWFSGVHCDIGGGYPETGLSDITFSWMIGKAANLGLQIANDTSAQYASLDAKYALDQIHESWNLLWLFPKARSVASNSAIGNSVAIRCEHDNSYQPENLSLTNGVPAGSYQTLQVVKQP
ncbi:MAG TPA: DUF2235 domain-containing protein [Candidatus Acidoferrum sp.]|jgi:uncharacterized protein (DUF2235 family)|nr:DUF2235 domain-containing protein [Candidatus Acidoferrum sp.]